MDNPQTSTSDPAARVHDFGTFWACLAERARCSGLAKSEWAMRASKLAGRHAQTDRPEHKPFSAKTLYDRTQHGRRVEWDEAQWFVRAVPELDVPSWKAAWERAEQRWLSAAKDEPLPAAEVEAPQTDPVPEWRWRKPALLFGVGIVAIGASAYALLGAASRLPSTAPPSNPAAPSAAPSPAPLAVPMATAANGAAHVEFYDDQNRFLLFDDRGDGRSAILQLRTAGATVQTWYNSQGKTHQSNPPKPIELPATARRSPLEFRVCVAKRGQPIPEETCGTWTMQPG